MFVIIGCQTWLYGAPSKPQSFYCMMQYSAKCSLAIACRLSVSVTVRQYSIQWLILVW